MSQIQPSSNPGQNFDKNRECPTNRGLLSKAAETISKRPVTHQFLIGTVSGWTTGFLTMKVGRKAAFAVGGSIILYQIAHHQGYVKMNLDQIREETKRKIQCKYSDKGPQWMANVKKFGRSNTYFAAGFVGGFLLGLAS